MSYQGTLKIEGKRLIKNLFTHVIEVSISFTIFNVNNEIFFKLWRLININNIEILKPDSK